MLDFTRFGPKCGDPILAQIIVPNGNIVPIERGQNGPGEGMIQPGESFSGEDINARRANPIKKKDYVESNATEGWPRLTADLAGWHQLEERS